MDWKALLACEDLSVKEALKKMDVGGQKILFITDKAGHFLGVVTDGNIRRHLLSDGRFEDRIAEIYNRKPVFLREKWEAEKAREIMLDKKIEVIPVVDRSRRIMDALCWTELFGQRSIPDDEKISVPVVIMAGGRGERLDPFTKILPKPLIPVGEKPIIEVIMNTFHRYGIEDFYVSLNYKGNMIKAYFDSVETAYKIDYLWEGEHAGTIGSLRMLGVKAGDTFLISNCDIIVDANYSDILRYHEKNRNVLTVIGSIQHHRIPYGIIHFEKRGKIKSIQEKPEYDFTVNTGVYVASREVISSIPPTGRFNMDELIRALLKKRRRVGVYPVSQKSYVDVGQWEEYKKTLEKFRLFE